jgi:porin
VAGFAVIYGHFSDDLRRAQRLLRRTGVATPVQDYELVFEWAYSIHLAHWARLEPDLQYIVKPGGSGAIPNAVVAGFQLTMTF